MKHTKTDINKIGLTLLIFACANSVQAQEIPVRSGGYPEAQLIHLMTQEDIESKRAEELESKAAEQRELLEKRRREIEIKVTGHQYNIENLKARQENAQGEIDALQADIKDLDGRIESAQKEGSQLEESTQKTAEYLDSLKKDYALKQTKLSDKLVAIQKAKLDADNMIYNKAIEIERMKSEYAQLETRVQEAEAKRAMSEADEVITRTAWMQTKLNLADKQRQREESLASARDAKQSHDKAIRDLAAARVDLAKAEKARAATAQQVAKDVSRFENEIFAASSKKVAAESEQIRLETEVQKLQEYASRIKSSRDKQVDEQMDASSMVLKTRVAVESARSELNKHTQYADQQGYRRDRQEAKNRGLAAASEASELFSGARRWVGSANCKMFGKPTLNGTPAGSVGSGSRVMAREMSNPIWLEVVNGNGISSYVESRCGKFED